MTKSRTIKTRSATVWISDNTVVKQYHPLNKKGYKNECFWLRSLASKSFVPKLLSCSDEGLSLTISYAGEPISITNAPPDWEDQMRRILSDLRHADCHHKDLSTENVLVHDGYLRIIDFGHASALSSEGGNKKRTIIDQYAVSRLRYLLNGFPQGSEIHVFVVWNEQNAESIEVVLGENLEIVDKISFSPVVYQDYFSDRGVWLKHFYDVPHLPGSKKGNVPFCAFIVLSQSPRYVPRKRVFSPETRVVNAEIFDLKDKLRKGREGYLHSSDNQEEARRNLRYLSYDESSLPFSYLAAARPQFQTMSELFHKLNRRPDTRYVLLRRPASDNPATGEDYDVLCDDYFSLKRALGGVSYKKHSKKLFRNVGPPVDEGGFKVANHVLVGGRKIPFDLRYVGDGYYPAAWQRKMLENRVLKNGIYVCSVDDEFFGTAYHALFHKVHVPKKYIEDFGSRLNISEPSEIESKLTTMVLAYLKEHRYSVTRPKDITMPFRPPIATGFAARREMFFVRRELDRRNYSGASKVVLNHAKIRGRPFQGGLVLLSILSQQGKAATFEFAKRWKSRIRRRASKLIKRVRYAGAALEESTELAPKREVPAGETKS